MTAPGVNRRMRAADGWIVFVLVAVFAFAGLSISERVATLRTQGALALRPGLMRPGPQSTWRSARLSSPSGDPRRVLALSGDPRNTTDALIPERHTAREALRAAIRTACDSAFLASSATQ